MVLRFTCQNCKRSGALTSSKESPFIHAPWFIDDNGWQHNSIYCRACGAVHDVVASLLGIFKLVIGRLPLKVATTLDIEAIKKLTIINNPGVPNLRSLNPYILAAMKEDGRIGDDDLKREPSLDFLLQCLKDENRLIKREAIVALRRFQDKRAVEPLIEALKDKSWEVRIDAAITLGELGDSRAVEPLNELIIRDVYKPAIKREAMLALEKIEKRRLK